MLALDLRQHGRLRGSTVVTTIMSNLGLEIALRELGVALVRTPVGDRYVLDEMVRGGFNLGGEQSGHIVQLDLATTGDGLITALSVLRLMAAAGRPLCELKRVMTKLPQVLINVPVSRRVELAENSPVVAVVRRVERALGDRSRVVVRYSGTEPLLRVMVEGESDDCIRAAANEIVTAVQTHLG
jgi:phosphoglucosamine mutase